MIEVLKGANVLTPIELKELELWKIITALQYFGMER